MPRPHGAGLGRVQEFLLSALKERSLLVYMSALQDLKIELERRGIGWSSWTQTERDEWLAEYFLGIYEDEGSVQKI